MAEMVMVKSLLPERDDGGFPVALYEQDAAHPDGEAFVAGPDPVEVARTGLVNRRISEGALEIVEKATTPEPDSRAVTGQTGTRDPFAGMNAAQRAALVEAGFDDAEMIQAATDDELESVDGIGKAAIATLRANTRE